MGQVKVISHLEETLEARYDGEDFTFVPDEPTVLSMEAATFIFQLGEEDKSRALNALGLLIPGKHNYRDALAKLEQIEFIEGKFKFDDEDDDDFDEYPDPNAAPGAPPLGRPRRKKTGGRRPHVDPSGGAGASPQGGAPAEPQP